MAKKRNNNRDDFSQTVVKHLGNRVNHICSNPDCQVVTVGPKATPDKASVIGKAAHITAAAEGGPRYDASLTPVQRSGIDNGIWLCANCHDKVDADPVRYPAELLRAWKQQAEDNASNRFGKPISTVQNPQRFPLKAPAILLEEFVPGSRDTELAALRTSLEQEHTVYLWGFGGMGKSETAIRLAHDLAPADKIFLMHYQNSMRETILKLNFEGYKLYATEATNTPETYAEADLRQRMKMLKDGYRDAILIVDNFDVEGKTIDELRSEPACQELLSGGFRLIFTTRSPLPRPDWEIKAMERAYQLKLMRSLAPDMEYNDDQLIELIEAVNGHTLTLSLMAKTMSKSWGDVTPHQILSALKNSHWEELESPDVVSGKDRDNTQRRIEAHLCALFDLSNLSDHARTVLCCATLLPDGGMKASLFRHCLPPEQKEALSNLAERNWLTRREGLLTIHPVMRQVCRMVLKPDERECGAFLEDLWKQYDDKLYDAPRFKQMGDCFALATDNLNSLNPWYPNHAGRLYSYVGLNDLGLAYFQKAVDLVEKHDPDNGEMLGTVWNDAGYSYSVLGNYGRALELYQSALDIRKKVLPEDHPDLALSYDNVGSAYSHLGDHKKALEFNQFALDIQKRILPENHPHLARSYGYVGIEYSYLGDHKKALKIFQTALDIQKQVFLEDHPDLARTYDHVGNEYSYLGDHKKALKFLQFALDIQKRVLPETHPDLGQSHRDVGVSLCNLKRTKEALPHLLKAMEIWEQACPPGHPDLTDIYNLLADYHILIKSRAKAAHFRLLAEENETKRQE